MFVASVDVQGLTGVGHRYSAYHHSHPTLTERLRALEGYKSAATSASKKEL